MKNLKNVVSIIVLMLIAVACSQLKVTTSNTVKANTWYPIGSIINNDSFEIIVGNHVEQVTFLALDIQPIHAEWSGAEIQQFLQEHLIESTEVKLTFDEEMRNEHGQLQAIVELKDGTIINEKMLEAGLAKVLIVEPNIKTENRYKQLEQLAKSSKNGIWINANETSNEDVPIKDMAYNGISLSVNKKEQKVTITNFTSKSIDLKNWKLVSVVSNKTYVFDSTIVKPLGKIIIVAKESSGSSSENTLSWGLTNIWGSSDAESAELYNKENELIAVWEE